MGSFAFKLEHKDGTPADPPVLHTAVPTWSAGTRSRSGQAGRYTSSRRGSGGRAKTPVLVIKAA
jgi:hypothetical protein